MNHYALLWKDFWSVMWSMLTALPVLYARMVLVAALPAFIAGFLWGVLTCAK